MKNIKGYVNAKKELEIIRLNIDIIKTKEDFLEKEKQELEKLERDIVLFLDKLEEALKSLKGIESELLCEIVVKGKNVTRAVEVVAFSYDMDTSTIWKSYYPKVKKVLQELDYV